MAAIVQHIAGAAGAFATSYNGGATPFTITNIPNAGDVLILRLTQSRSGSKFVSVTGCGATWTRVANSNNSDESVQFWMGIGATTTGTVTATATINTWARGSLTHVSGLTATTVVADGTVSNASSGADPGPVISATNGQIVFASAYQNNMNEYPSVGTPPDPATGWTFDAVGADLNGYESATGYRIPTSTANHQVTANNTGTGTGFHLLMVMGDEVIPDIDVEPPAATATASAPAPVLMTDDIISAPPATASASAPAPLIGDIEVLNSPAATATATAHSSVMLVGKDPFIWDDLSDRYFQHGVDRGVLYPSTGDAVVWNGIIGVDESNDSSQSIYYIDGRIYCADVDPGDFRGSLTAYFWPDKFSECLGIPEVSDGLYVDNQKPKRFDLAYRSLIGSGTTGDMFGYQIHLVYKAMATLGTRSRKTINNTPAPMEFSFDLVCTPVQLPGYRPSAHYIIDTRHLDEATIAQLEGILYGDEINTPRMPTPEELYDLLNFGSAITFTDHGDGTWTARGSYANVHMTGTGTWEILNVNGTDNGDGTYTLEDTP